VYARGANLNEQETNEENVVNNNIDEDAIYTQVFPNPSTTKINVAVLSKEQKPITITLYTILGEQLQQQQTVTNKGISSFNTTNSKGEYIAQGGENHITLGNFRDDKESDTLVLPVGVNVSPSLHSYYFLDDVSVICLDCPIDEVSVGIGEQAQSKNVFYNNSTNALNVSEQGNLVIYNMQGAKVFEQNVKQEENIHLQELTKSVYVWQLQTEKDITRGKFVISE
jgi:hypothetical protein